MRVPAGLAEKRKKMQLQFRSRSRNLTLSNFSPSSLNPFPTTARRAVAARPAARRAGVVVK